MELNRKNFANKSEKFQYVKAIHVRLSSMRRRKLLQLSEAQGNRCAYCCGETWHRQTVEWDWENKPDGPKSNDTQATLEHLRPQCRKEQTNQDENLVMACGRCNGLRGVHNPYKFFEQIRRYTPPVPLGERVPEKEKLTPEQEENLPYKNARLLTLCLIAIMFWPGDSRAAIDMPSDGFTRKQRKKLKNRAYKINKWAEHIVQDPRRLAA